jgi:ribosomal-protein-alanine N-acetyltransferase
MSSAPLLPDPAPAPVTVRRGGADDIGLVEAIMADAFDPAYGEAWTRGQCLGVLAMPGVSLLMALGGDAPAGFAMVRTVLDEAELLLLAVARAARRQGIGAALLARVLEDAEARGAACVHLEVRADNPAVDLYRAHGFAKNGERRAYYRGADGRARDAHSFVRRLA